MSKRGRAGGTSGWQKKIARRFDARPEFLLPILRFVQEQAGHLPAEALAATAKHLGVPERKVSGVASFYPEFSHAKQGRHRITLCCGSACHERGGRELAAELAQNLDPDPDGTTEDQLFSVERVACVGACTLAPVVVIDRSTEARQNPTTLRRLVNRIRADEGAPVAPTKHAAKKTTKKTTKKTAKKKPPRMKK